MKIPLPLYDALMAANVPADKAKAVVEAWQIDVEKLATESDLQQVEIRLNASLIEIHTKMRVMRLQLGATFVCSVIPLLKLGFDLVAQTET